MLLLGACATPTPPDSASEAPEVYGATPTTAAPPAPAPRRLAALTATSGNPRPWIDGDATTPFLPFGDPQLEGVWFRFEAATAIDAVRLIPCGEQPATVRLHVDGGPGITATVGPAEAVVPLARSLTELFVAIEHHPAGACIGEVRFDGAPHIGPRELLTRASASSSLVPPEASPASAVLDGRPDLPWIEGATGPGLGERLQLDLAEPVEIESIEIWNGHQRSAAHFAAYGRVRKLRLTVDDTPILLDVPDQPGSSRLRLGDFYTGTRVALEVVDTTQAGPDAAVALSAVRLWDTAGPIALRDAAPKARAFHTLTQARPTPLALRIDGALDELCGGGALRLRSNNTFTWRPQDGAPIHGSWAFTDPADAVATFVVDGAPLGRPEGAPDAALPPGPRRHGQIRARRATQMERAELDAFVARSGSGDACAVDAETLITRDAVVLDGVLAGAYARAVDAP